MKTLKLVVLSLIISFGITSTTYSQPTEEVNVLDVVELSNCLKKPEWYVVVTANNTHIFSIKFLVDRGLVDTIKSKVTARLWPGEESCVSRSF